jgi:brefeldin A-inhibited guanine nucleotide-exchange protein
MVLIILSSHMDILASPTSIIYSSTSHEATSFAQMANQYLCLCLSRNAVSPVPQVFEISVEIFWRTLSGLRTKLKKEIEVLFHEIFIPILEMKTSTLKQKSVILSMLLRLCQDPQALVDIYINYDCDSEAVDNIYEQLVTTLILRYRMMDFDAFNSLVNVITKLSSTTQSALGQKNVESAGSTTPSTVKPQNANLAPSLSTTALSGPSTTDPTTPIQSEAQLRRQGLECLVAVLRSLVAWGTGKSAALEDHTNSVPTPDASASLDRLPLHDVVRGPTPDIADDPSRFESAKQKKTTLMEGIKRFNQKPKKVSGTAGVSGYCGQLIFGQGIQFLVETGFIPGKGPQDVAKFLLNTDGLSKAMIGEYLGEGCVPATLPSIHRADPHQRRGQYCNDACLC